MLWLALAFVACAAALYSHRAGEQEDPELERRLIERLATRDAAALAALYDRHARPIYSLALRILQDQADAEDVAQEVFAQAWQQAARYDVGRGTVAGWLLNMTRSRAIDLLRARRSGGREVRGDQETPAMASVDPAPRPEALAVTAQQAAAVRAALQRLPALQRVALELAYFDGLSQSEIAAQLDQPLGTVKTRIRLGLLKLREAMVEQS
jgi:RNA polymerase sigma-70 factor (ECF subfamily)